jgi:surface carbohydrate biosynthesis protein
VPVGVSRKKDTINAVKKVNILFPIETTNRELDFRLFQGCLTARPNNRIFIGHGDVMYRLVQSTEGGLYVGKNLRPASKKADFVKKMDTRLDVFRERGFRLMNLDEEGGVMAGDEERWRDWLNKRLGVRNLDANDHVCTWGEWQREYYQSLAPDCSANITTTGHPRFDLYKESNRRYYDPEVKQIQERYGDFVLINTNFAWANNRHGNRGTFSRRFYYDPANGEKRLDHVRQWGFTWRVLSGMVELVTRLSVEMPHLNYVFRPHPSENMAFYQSIFEHVPNVHVVHEGSVGAWLLASRAMIHDGCTTALEAHFSQVPIINYKSAQDTRYDLMLPNLLGTQCCTQEEALQEIERILAAPTREAAIKPLSDEVKHTTTSLIHNFSHNSAQLLANRVLEVSDRIPPSEAGFKMTAFNSYSRIQPTLRSVKQRVKPSKGREGQLHKFLGWTKSQMQDKLRRAQEITNTEVKCTIHSEELLSIEC